MEYTGLTSKYPVNRPLTDREREFQLHQKQRLELEPAHQLSVIRLNSTFLELVDKYYAWKGFITTTCIAAAAVLCGGQLYLAISFAVDANSTLYSTNERWLNAVGLVTLATGIAFLLSWLLRKESFAHTHYPIRLNRKTRMIHLFRLDGSILSVPWEEVFFCLGALRQNGWEIQGHVLDRDGVSVRETFAFMLQGVGTRERDQLRQYWEFVRRYMEEGPQAVSGDVRFCLPISSKRESFIFGFHRTHFDAGAIPLVIQILVLALYLVTYPGRWIAMRTSKIPVWPKVIDDACRVDPGDLFIRDASMNPPGLR